MRDEREVVVAVLDYIAKLKKHGIKTARHEYAGYIEAVVAVLDYIAKLKKHGIKTARHEYAGYIVVAESLRPGVIKKEQE